MDEVAGAGLVGKFSSVITDGGVGGRSKISLPIISRGMGPE